MISESKDVCQETGNITKTFIPMRRDDDDDRRWRAFFNDDGCVLFSTLEKALKFCRAEEDRMIFHRVDHEKWEIIKEEERKQNCPVCGDKTIFCECR